MDLLRRLFGPPNPTRDWTPQVPTPLVFDLQRYTLHGIGLGDPWARLSFLGPAAYVPGMLVFPQLGLEVDIDPQVVEGFMFSFVRDRQGQPFVGTFQDKKGPVPLSASTSETELMKRWGVPYWREEDSDEIILFFEHPGREWQVELKLDGTLKRLVITTVPLMADPDQRHAYGVTAAWPPEWPSECG